MFLIRKANRQAIICMDDAVCPILGSAVLHRDAHGDLASQPYEPPVNLNPPAPQVPSSTPDVSPHTVPNCRIPNCQYKAYYNYAEQEQTEYCGQGHELCVYIDTTDDLVSSNVILLAKPWQLAW